MGAQLEMCMHEVTYIFLSLDIYCISIHIDIYIKHIYKIQSILTDIYQYIWIYISHIYKICFKLQSLVLGSEFFLHPICRLNGFQLICQGKFLPLLLSTSRDKVFYLYCLLFSIFLFMPEENFKPFTYFCLKKAKTAPFPPKKPQQANQQTNKLLKTHYTHKNQTKTTEPNRIKNNPKGSKTQTKTQARTLLPK